MIIVLMGVTGSGKSTVGKLLASQLGWKFVEGDDFHSSTNIKKLRRGEPLSDEDRRPWLEAIREVIRAATIDGRWIHWCSPKARHTTRTHGLILPRPDSRR